MNKRCFFWMIGMLFSCSITAQLKYAPATYNTFMNPILSGDSDPGIMRDGKDYYMTHSAFDYLPGLTVLHSTDLVNWEPVSYAYTAYLGSGWAPDICKHDDKYYIYFTVANKGNYVVYATWPVCLRRWNGAVQ
jgi:xylan 1,4-beta-xylosidase